MKRMVYLMVGILVSALLASILLGLLIDGITFSFPVILITLLIYGVRKIEKIEEGKQESKEDKSFFKRVKLFKKFDLFKSRLMLLILGVAISINHEELALKLAKFIIVSLISIVLFSIAWEGVRFLLSKKDRIVPNFFETILINFK